ncbi:MAG: hypothetical protein AAF468_03330 [Pseudomonadota bacterium]
MFLKISVSAPVIFSAFIASYSHAGTCELIGEYGRGSDKAKLYLSDDKVITFTADMDINTDGSIKSYKIDDLGFLNSRRRIDTRSALNTICNGVSILNSRNVRLSMSCTEEIKEFQRIRDFGWLKAGENYVNFFGIELKEKAADSPRGVYKGIPCEHGGYYVSQVARSFGGRYGDCSVSKWPDALKIPGIVVPLDAKLRALGVKHHDLAIVRLHSNGDWIGAIVGDTNPNKVGEATVFTAMKLRNKAEPTSYRQSVALALGYDKVEYVVFPGTADELQPLNNASNQKIQAAAQRYFREFNLASRKPVCN